MKMVIATVAVLASFLSYADAISKEYKKFADSRRYCVSRIIENDKVITTWYRNGRPDWKMPSVVTNNLKTITGKEQNNPVQNKLVIAEVDAKKARKVEKAAEKAKKKDSKNFNKWVSDTEKAKSKSSEDMAEFYDSILEIAHAYEDN